MLLTTVPQVPTVCTHSTGHLNKVKFNIITRKFITKTSGEHKHCTLQPFDTFRAFGGHRARLLNGGVRVVPAPLRRIAHAVHNNTPWINVERNVERNVRVWYKYFIFWNLRIIRVHVFYFAYAHRSNYDEDKMTLVLQWLCRGCRDIFPIAQWNRLLWLSWPSLGLTAILW